MFELIIRVATKHDLAAVNRLLVETWHDTYDQLIGAEKVTQITTAWHAVPRLAQQIEAPSSSFLVAELSRTIVGHAFGQAQTEQVLTLARLYVLPAHQRVGIGARLLNDLMARHPDCPRIIVDVEQDNTNAVSFYRRRGFVVEGEAADDGIKTFRMGKWS